MATTEDKLTQAILELLSEVSEGMEADKVIECLKAQDATVSPRGVRNLLNRLVVEKELVRRKRRADGPGAPTAIYVHKNFVPRQLSIFDDLDIEGIESIQIKSRAEVEEEAEADERDPEERQSRQEERKRQQASNSVLGNIAYRHVYEESLVRAITEIAPELAQEKPIDLILQMVQWIVDDLNNLADEVNRLMQAGDASAAEAKGIDLETHIGWTRRNIQKLWRLDPGPNEDEDILHLPHSANNFVVGGKRAKLNQAKARECLSKRINGNRIIEIRSVENSPSSAAGTDASVADIVLEHKSGSFLPPDPLALMTAAASLVVRPDPNTKFGYQDFDIFPDQLRDYNDNQAAVKGLIISPHLSQHFAERDFKHSRLAAMDLRQYNQDSRIVLRQAEWRPVGGVPSLGVVPKPTLIFRDGRALPSVHRLRDFESGGLYGKLVQSQIQTYSDVVVLTQARPGTGTVYGAVVKNPEMSWLAPLVFWYLHRKKKQVAERQVVENPADVYRVPFSDTAVSHLLFLGLAKQEKDFSEGKVYITFRMLRRFSDIADVDEDGLPQIQDGNSTRLLNEDDVDDWLTFIEQRIEQMKQRRRPTLEVDDYAPFIHLCTEVGVSMCYTAPCFAYEQIVMFDTGESGHFLLPRLESTVLVKKWKDEDKHLDPALAWLATNGCELDRAHTQSAYDTGNREQGLPILVPDVVVLAHEAATFARNTLSEEVQDEIQSRIAELRNWLKRGRP